MTRNISFKGKPYTLIGRSLALDTRAPDFRVISKDLQETNLSAFGDKIKILTTFLSLDTSVCENQVKEFNRRATQLSPDIVVVGISKDLPFAQKRFCEASSINQAVVLSDYKYSSFGINYGVLIKEMNLLSRAIFIVDKNNVLRYIQVVQENSRPPDYDDAFRNLEAVLKKPAQVIKTGLPEHCKPCEGGTPPLDAAQTLSLLNRLEGWELIEGKKIMKRFKFKDFTDAKYFLDLVAVIAEDQNHHPSLTLDYNKLDIMLWTHAAKGLTENDFIIAKAINDLTT